MTSMGVTTTHFSEAAEIWGIFAVALGSIVLITSALNSSSFSKGRMPFFGTLMIVYGTAMIFLGALMFSGVAPMMGGENVTLVSSLGMLMVGAFMLLNGSAMIRMGRAVASRPAPHPEM